MKYILFILVITLLSCQKKKSETKAFFDFDDLEYYHVDFDIKNFKPIQNVSNKEEKKFYDILRFSYPENINEKELLTNLKKFYIEKKIDKSKFEIINKIYTEKNHKDAVYASCAPFYRDILVFKKSGEIVGVSKICFECNVHKTIGSKRSTENLGQSGDFAKLEKLLVKLPAANSGFAP